MTLEEIDSVDKFVDNLEKLELPNQLAAVLADPLLQKLTSLRPDAEANERVSNWVAAAAQDVLSGETDRSLAVDVLSVLQDYVAKTKVRCARMLQNLAY